MSAVENRLLAEDQLSVVASRQVDRMQKVAIVVLPLFAALMIISVLAMTQVLAPSSHICSTLARVPLVASCTLAAVSLTVNGIMLLLLCTCRKNPCPTPSTENQFRVEDTSNVPVHDAHTQMSTSSSSEESDSVPEHPSRVVEKHNSTEEEEFSDPVNAEPLLQTSSIVVQENVSEQLAVKIPVPSDDHQHSDTFVERPVQNPNPTIQRLQEEESRTTQAVALRKKRGKSSKTHASSARNHNKHGSFSTGWLKSDSPSQ